MSDIEKTILLTVRNLICSRKALKKVLFINKVFLLIVLITFTYQCKIDKNDPEAEINSRFTVMTNSLDPQILSANASDGRTIDIFGVRDEYGMPVNLNQIVIKDSNENELVYYLDELNRPTEMIAENNTQFKLEWLLY